MLASIWKEKKDAFRAMARSILKDKSLADDVLQEAFTKALRTGKRFVDRDEAFYYLRTAVLNTAIDNYRKFCRRSRYHVSKPIPLDLFPSRNKRTNPLTRLLHKEEQQNQEDLLEEVERALTKLTPQQQEAIEIFFSSRENQKIKEICREKGVPYSTLRSRMLRGIDLIRGELRSKGVSGFFREKT